MRWLTLALWVMAVTYTPTAAQTACPGTDLRRINPPFSGSTRGRPRAHIPPCTGEQLEGEHIFHALLQPGEGLNIRLTASHDDTTHVTYWGGEFRQLAPVCTQCTRLPSRLCF